MRNLRVTFLYHDLMPISHVCTGCGTDLAQLRAEPDPRYGLRVVVCPRCQSATVRTREPMIAGWRHARRFVAAGVLALTHLALLPVLSVAFTGFAYAQSARWIDPTAKRLVNDPDAPLMLILMAFALLAGLWLGLTVTHRSVLARVGVWYGMLAMPILIVAMLAVRSRPDRPYIPGAVEAQPMFVVYGLAIAAGSGVVVALAEIPAWMGRLLGRMAGSVLFRWRRNAVRRRRSGQ